MSNVCITGIEENSLDIMVTDEFIANLQKELNIHRLRSSWINVKFAENLVGDDLDEFDGDCEGDTDEVDIRISKNMDWKDQMITLAHEMVHAEQILRGKFVDNYIWKGRSYEKAVDNECYEYLPWEMSAWQLQEKLYKKCYPEWALNESE
tara:strand:+ start:57 stop:506 length:450 start_codon:yes stop_codon:yes gene_type:complete